MKESTGMKTLIFLRGEPGVGKLTTAKMLKDVLHWRLFHIHDLDPVARMFDGLGQARLLDDLTGAVLNHLFQSGESVIYVRPSRDLMTVERVLGLARFHGYRSLVVRLVASQETLEQRVTWRKDEEERKAGGPTRVTTADGLRRYQNGRKLAKIEGELVVCTDAMSPAQVSVVIQDELKREEVRS